MENSMPVNLFIAISLFAIALVFWHLGANHRSGGYLDGLVYTLLSVFFFALSLGVSLGSLLVGSNG
jgi:hypothetical protein